MSSLLRTISYIIKINSPGILLGQPHIKEDQGKGVVLFTFDYTMLGFV